MDEICGDERRVHRGRVCNWSKVSTEDGPCKLSRQQLQRSESKRVKRIPADVVKVEIVHVDFSLAGCPRVVRFMRENGVHQGASCKRARAASAEKLV